MIFESVEHIDYNHGPMPIDLCNNDPYQDALGSLVSSIVDKFEDSTLTNNLNNNHSMITIDYISHTTY